MVDFFKKIYFILFKPSTFSFQVLHSFHRQTDGTYLVPYSEFVKLQRKTRQISFVSIFFVTLSIAVLTFYSPSQEQRFSQAATISSNIEYTTDTTHNEDVVIDTGAIVTLTGGITWQINGNLTVNGTILFQETGGTYTTYPTLKVSGNVTVESTGKIDSDGKGFAGGALGGSNGGGDGGGAGSALYAGGGAAHGGAGGNAPGSGGAGSTVLYDFTFANLEAGSGGGGGKSKAGGAGGGIILIDVGGTTTVNGTITADGAGSATAAWGAGEYTGGGGAGGSIYLTTGTLDGTGSLTATGGKGGDNGSVNNGGGGGGSGGRIAVYFNTPGASIATLKSNSSVLGGVGGDSNTTSDGYIGEPGTLFFLDVDDRDIEIYNGPNFFQEGDTVTLSGTQATFTGNPKFGDSDVTTNDNDAVFDDANSTTQFNDITIKQDAYVESEIVSGNTLFDLTLDHTGTFTIESPSGSDGSCRVFSQGVVQDSSFDTCFIFEKFTLKTQTFTLNSNGQILGDGYGNSGGAAGANNGNGDGGGTGSATDAGGGGAYGGTAGNGALGVAGGSAHGSTLAPVTAGSGGGGGQGSAGGSGGGIIRLDIAGTSTLNGTVTVDGSAGTNTASNEAGGGGAGGSIYLTSATLDGSGSLTATGGRGGNNTSANNGGGGGGSGGRIAVYFNTPGASIATLKSNSSVLGGVGGDSNTTSDGYIGEPGTLFFLDVDNKDIEIYNGGNFFRDGDSVSFTANSTEANLSGSFGDTNATANIAEFGNSSTNRFDDITIKADAYLKSAILSGNDIFDLRMNFTGIFTFESPSSNDGSCRSFGRATTQDASFDTCFVVEKINLTGPTVTLNSNVQIYGSGYGNTGGSAGANNGNGDGGGTGHATLAGGGGGHGGAGGNAAGSGGAGGASHGSNTAPVTTGSGGGGGQGSAGGNGGGAVRIDSTGTVTVSGKIDVNGTAGTDAGTNEAGGGGSGGSIYITSNTLTGSGSLTATGGRGGNNASANYGGGGGAGGGRVAYYYTASTFAGSATVTGGAAGDGNGATDGVAGSAGTTYTYQYSVPTQPTISSPTDGTNNSSTTPTLTSSAFSGDLTHTSTDWEIDDNNDFASPTFSSTDDTTNKTSITVSPALSSGTTYYARVRYTSTAGDSSWSETVSFTTLANTPGTPDFGSPTTSSVNIGIDVNSNPASIEFAIQEVNSGNYVQANGSLGVSAVWQNYATWGTITVSGLSANTQYTFKIKARNSASIETDFGGTIAGYTLANVPSVPTVNGATATTLNVTLATNSNPSTTQFAIQEVNSGNYVQANGTLSVSEAWQTNASWGTKTVTGLSSNTQYSFKTKARNGENNETALGDAAAAYTLANTPSAPTVNTPATSSLKVIINENSNPSTTTFVIQETGSGNYVQADGTLAGTQVWQTKTNWGGANGVTVSGLSLNTQYTFQIKAKDSSNNETSFGASQSLYTLANAPSTPTLNTPTTSSLKVIVNANSNPASTEFALEESTSGNYVQADGSLGVSSVWQNITNWGGVSGTTITGRSVNTQYVFRVKARNGNSTETDFSSTTSLYTAANTPSAPTVNTPATSSLKVTINENSNPSTVQYAIQETSSGLYVGANGTREESATWQTYTNWGGISGITVSSLSVNTQYTFKIKARNGDTTETEFSATASVYTLSETPGTPTLSSVNTTSITVTIDPAGNSEIVATQFAIQETLATGYYVQVDGTLGSDSVWQNFSTWGGASGIIITGLSLNTQHTFRVKSRSEEETESNFGDSTSATTLANVPGSPTVTAISGSGTTLKLVVDANSNPSLTEFLIQETSQSQNVQANGTLAVTEVWQTRENWGGDNGVTISGLSPNTEYIFKVKARNTVSNVETVASGTSSRYTLANIPGIATVGSPTSTTLNIILDTNGNSASTQFAIQETTLTTYVQADGSLAVDPVWRNITNWGGATGFTISGLSGNTAYAFRVKARNGNETETEFGSGSSSKYTAPYTPGTPAFQNPTSSSLDIVLNLNNNPENTEFSIREQSSSNYVQSGGTLNSTQTWLSYLSWGGATGKRILGLVADTLYSFIIKARNGENVESDSLSTTSSVRTLADAPNGLSTVGDTESSGFTFTFSPANNPATVEYAIYTSSEGKYLESNGGTWGSNVIWKTYEGWGAGSGIEVISLRSNTTYSIQIKSRNSSGVETSLSDALFITTQSGGALAVNTTPPPAPLNVAVEEYTNYTALLTWTDPTDRISRIEILRGAGNTPVSGNPYQVIQPGVGRFIDENVDRGVRYQYQVRAVDVNRNISNPSIPVSLIITPETPSQPEKDSTPVPTQEETPTQETLVIPPSTEETPINEKQKEPITPEVSPDPKKPVTTLEVKVPEGALKPSQKLIILELEEDLLLRLPKEIYNRVISGIHSINIYDEEILTNSDALSPLELSIEYRPEFFIQTGIDFRRVVLGKWDPLRSSWVDLPLQVCEENRFCGFVEKTGFYAVRVKDEIQKWSENSLAQMNVPDGSTKPNTSLSLVKLPEKFVAKANKNMRGPIGFAYNLILLGAGFQSNTGSLEKVIEFTLRYDPKKLQNTSSCEKLLLMRYDGKIRKWEEVQSEHACREGFFKALIQKLGVYSIMQKE